MVSLEYKKLEILQRLANSFNEAIFDKIKELLDKEESETDFIPDTYYNLLMEEREKYLIGHLHASSWSEVEERIKKKYGL